MRTRYFPLLIFVGLALAWSASLSSPANNEVLVSPVQSHPGSQGLRQSGAMRKAETALARLAAEHEDFTAQKRGGSFKPSNKFLQFHQGRVLIQARATADAQDLLKKLERQGLDDGQYYGNMVSGWLPVGKIKKVAGLPSVRAISAVRHPVRNAGSVTSQGDTALRADIARSPAGFSVDGSGVTVGVLSDSYDASPLWPTTAADDIASGDLPPGDPVATADGESDLCGALVTCTDEGRAMMQIVHDVAPGADQLFHTGLGGPVAYANAITELAALGANVLVDDLAYVNEPMFQDGIVAQAVDDAVANGAVYFSAAGNSGRNSYEAPFVDSGEDFCIVIFTDGECDPIY